MEIYCISSTQTRQREALEGNEVERLLSAAKEYGGEISAIVSFAIETAMRRGEIVGLRWENINKVKRTTKLLDTKNGENRSVPLSPAAQKILDSLPRNINGRFFSMRSDSITNAFDRCCKLTKVEDLRFHDLRYEATSRFFELGHLNHHIPDIHYLFLTISTSAYSPT